MPPAAVWNSTQYRSVLLSRLEDGLLASGGLFIALSTGLGAPLASHLLVVALLVASFGKAAPSLIAQFWVRPVGPFPVNGHRSAWAPSAPPVAGTGSGSEGATNPIDAWVVVGDSSLFLLAIAAGISYYLVLPGHPAGVEWFTGLIGLSFVAKGFVDLLEQTVLAWKLDQLPPPSANPPAAKANGSPPSASAAVTTATDVGSRVFEAILMLAFGLAAFVLAWNGEVTMAVGAGSALGLGALAKALPSVLSAADGKSSSPQ
ncbi:MAG: hypothetical protein ACHQ2Y_07280 [Candidatus Lutacidiplasmatales archaeon]